LNRNDLVRGGDIAMEDFLHILRTADGLLGNEQLGLLLGQKLHVFALGPVGAGMAAAPDLRRGLQMLESFSRLHATYVDIRSRSTLPGLTVTILYGHETGYVERFHSETAMLLLQQYMETLVGETIEDARYRFAHPAPANQHDYRQLWHGSISFDANVSEVDIAHRWLDLPSPYYDAALWHQAQLSLAKDLKAMSESEGAPHAQHIATLLRTSEVPLPDLGEVALGLHISARTLNRRLKAESTSFRLLKSQALSSRAKLYLLETDLSVEAIAETLGYTDTANFRRAFRKSEGCSPSEYRSSVVAPRS
jgi:AraC-like DNA-binding protein